MEADAPIYGVLDKACHPHCSRLTWMIIENTIKDVPGEGIVSTYLTWGIVVFGCVIGLITAVPMVYTLLVPIDAGAFFCGRC